MQLHPFTQQFFLEAVFRDADPFPVQRFIIFQRNLFVIRRNKNIICLRAHGQGSKHHIFRPLLHERDIAHQVDLAVFQLLQKLRPGPRHILVMPSGKSGHLTLVFIGIPGTSSVFICNKIRRFMPANAHHLIFLRLGAGG